MTEWMDIATAPLDEDHRFLAVDKSGRQSIVSFIFTEDDGRPVFWDGNLMFRDLVAWQELQDPPKRTET